MNLRKSLCVTVAALALFVVAGAAANSRGSGYAVVHYDVTVAGSPLASGSYNVEWQSHSPEATVIFSQKGFFQKSKVAATVEGKVVDRGTAYPSNEVVYDQSANGSRVIQELRFKGSSEVIVFNN
jgi:hypothetical protein